MNRGDGSTATTTRTIGERSKTMSEKMQAWGLVSTNCVLNLWSSELDSGKWSGGPAAQIPADAQNFGAFFAQGKDSTATGAVGNAQYLGPDGTRFILAFSVPYKGYDSGSLTPVPNPPGSTPPYTCSFSFTGDDVGTFYYSIQYNG
jgi:hypothetical protein